MEDNKLTEFEEKIFDLVIKWSLPVNQSINSANKKVLTESIRQTIPPTCTPNERKFLDEIREKGYWASGCQIQIESGARIAILNQAMFDSSLSELVEKKE